MKLQSLVAALVFSVGCTGSEVSEGVNSLLRLEEIGRYGSTDGVGSSLTAVAGVAVTDSTVLVLERTGRLAVFAHDGQWLRDIGRPGDGPGELRRPSYLGVIDDRVWVGDPGGGRLELFGLDGNSVESYRWDIPPDSLGSRSFPMSQLSDGSVLAGPGSLSIGAAVRGAVTHRSYARATPAGGFLGEVYREWLDPDGFFQADIGSNRMMLGVHPIRSSPLTSPYPDGSGLVVIEREVATSAERATFQVRVFAADGTEELVVPINYDPIAADGWLGRHLKAVEEDMVQRTGAVDRGFLDAIREGMAERRFYPPVTKVQAGLDGSVWIGREETASDAVLWQLLARSGRQMGSLLLPKGVDIVQGSLNEAWTVEKDTYDVPFVVRYRILR